MKKYLVTICFLMSIGSVTQSMFADVPVGLDLEKRFGGPRRAPKKNNALLNLYIDEDNKILRFVTTSDEYINVIVFDNNGMFVLHNALYIGNGIDGIMDISSLKQGEYTISVYIRGKKSGGNFIIR